MKPGPQRGAARYHVDVAVAGSGAAAALAAALLQARGVRVALVGDPVRALSYELAGFVLPKRPWWRAAGAASQLHDIYTELGLSLAAHSSAVSTADSFVAPQGVWPWDHAEYIKVVEHGWDAHEDESPYRVFFSKLDKHLSASADSAHRSALLRDAGLREQGSSAIHVDTRLMTAEMVRRVASTPAHHLAARTLPMVTRDRKGPFLLNDASTGAALYAETIVWEGDARAFHAHSKDEATGAMVRAPYQRFRAAVVSRGASRADVRHSTYARFWLVLPDTGPLVEAVAMPGAGDTTVWLLSTDARVQDVAPRRSVLQGFTDYLLAAGETVLLADSVFDGAPVQLLDGEALRSVPRAELRARGLSVEPEAADVKYLIAPYAAPPHQAHPSTLRDLPVHFVGPALYPDSGFEGEICSVLDAVNTLAPKKRKGLLQ